MNTPYPPDPEIPVRPDLAGITDPEIMIRTVLVALADDVLARFEPLCVKKEWVYETQRGPALNLAAVLVLTIEKASAEWRGEEAVELPPDVARQVASDIWIRRTAELPETIAMVLRAVRTHPRGNHE